MRGKTSKQDLMLIESLEADDSQAILEYGLGVQTELADFSGNLLDQMRSVKTGEIEYPLERLMMHIRASGVGDISYVNHGMRAQKKAKKTLKRFNKIDKQVFDIEVELDEVRGELMRDIVRLKKLKEKTEAHRMILDQYIKTADKALAEVSQIMKKHSAVQLLEKRVHDLKLARVVSLQMSPQIDLIVKANETLVSKIQTSLMTTIPLWRSQMLIAKTLIKQKNAENIEQTVMAETAGMLDRNNISLKEEIERMKSGAGTWSHLEKTSNTLIAAIDNCQEISRLRAEETQHAQAALFRLRNELTEKPS